VTPQQPRNRLDTAEPFDDWPEPLPLRDELPPVVPFNGALLPTHLRGWVMDIAERMNCPPDLVAIPAMVSAGSLIGRRCLIRPQSKTLWQEAGNLWGIVVAPPGSLKTPAAGEALAPLRRLEAKAAEEHTGAMEAHKVAERLHKLKDNQVQNRVKEMLDKQGRGDVTMEASALLAAITEPEPPQSRRYMTSDATAEKLGEICAANPQGLLVHRDELMSLCTDLDHPEKAAARGFMMAGWGGLDSYTFDRIQRGTIRIPAVNISLFGTTQPQRIATYVRESLRRMDDGMVQRFQLLAWPDFGSAFHEVDRHPEAQARNTAFQCYERMAGLDPIALGAMRDDFDGEDAVPYLRFSGDAQEAFASWRVELEASIRDEDMPATLAAHFSKYRGLLPRLALICHLTSGGSGPVTLAALEMAKSWITYLESHARRVYASTEIDNAEAARAIWRRVKKGELPQPFTSREIQRRGWSMLKTKERIDGGLTSLVDAYWLRKTTSATGGRPSDIYMPNPKAARL
jgi:hypothetical protein